jgi:Carbohydrate-binding family 9
MLARCPAVSTIGAMKGAQTVPRPGTGFTPKRVEAVAAENGPFFIQIFLVHAAATVNLGAASKFASQRKLDAMSNRRTAVAVQMLELPDADGFPTFFAWGRSAPLRFNTDWRGENADPERETEVKLLWTSESLYLRFRARFRVITVFRDAQPNGRRDQLWDRDVAEVFLQPDLSQLGRYKEFEVSPNGFWIDLDIAPGEKHDLKSGLRRRVMLNEAGKNWVAELALPMKCLVESFDPEASWKVNFYRVEGAAEPRFYSAWRPTRTPVPNFHVPEAFGELIFLPEPLPRK